MSECAGCGVEHEGSVPLSAHPILKGLYPGPVFIILTALMLLAFNLIIPAVGPATLVLLNFMLLSLVAGSYLYAGVNVVRHGVLAIKLLLNLIAEERVKNSDNGSSATIASILVEASKMDPLDGDGRCVICGVVDGHGEGCMYKAAVELREKIGGGGDGIDVKMVMAEEPRGYA